jgi:4-carboxymuconolactone decarboxylase
MVSLAWQLTACLEKAHCKPYKKAVSIILSVYYKASTGCSLTGGNGLPPHFEQLRKDFPELADLTLKYSLGDIWGREVLDNKTRQLVSLAGFAAQGTMPQFKVHAQYALNYGVTPQELMEVIYITTVTSGYPRALIAAGTLKELFIQNKIKFPITSQK